MGINGPVIFLFNRDVVAINVVSLSGTLMELGISPIVTSGLIMQVNSMSPNACYVLLPRMAVLLLDL